MAIFLKRDTKVYLKKTVESTSVIWEIPVLDGFSFSQANTTSEVTLNEMESATGYSKRGRRAFNDALAPAEWSLSTYIRPFKSSLIYSGSATTGTGAGLTANANTVHAVEEQLWANFVGKGTWLTEAGGLITASLTVAATGLTVRTPNVTYEVDQGEYTTTGTGFGATFAITVTAANDATVTVINPGKGYVTSAGLNTITIPGSVVGGTGSITLTITGVTAATPAYDVQTENFTRDTTDLNISFAGSAVGTLGTFDLFFVMGATTSTTLNYSAGSTIEIFKLANCVVNEATVNFEVDGIAMIEWSGNASTLTTEASFDARAAIIEGVSNTDNFIRNKLTALSLVSNPGVTRLAFPGALVGAPIAIGSLVAGKAYEITVAGAGANWTSIGATSGTVGTKFIYNGVTAVAGTGSPTATELGGTYNITLTGGSVTFSNNVTYLTPETLGIVNQPIGHITGNKSITGNFTAYVDFGLANDSGALFDGATSATARSIVTNSFSTIFKVGGSTGRPRFELSFPTTHLEIPTIQTDDVIAIDVAFSALPSSITSNDEATLTYVAVA